MQYVRGFLDLNKIAGCLGQGKIAGAPGAPAENKNSIIIQGVVAMLLTKRTRLAVSISMVLGASVVSVDAQASLLSFDWIGKFTILDADGEPYFNNTLINENGFQTPVSGTMTWDTASATGALTLHDSDWDGPLTSSTGFSMVDIDGPGGSDLVLGNALMDWNGNLGIPVSTVWDASGLFSSISAGLVVGNTISGVGAAPASDGTYIGLPYGYFSAGPTPLATTTFNTSNAPGCSHGTCDGVNPSGALPLLVDFAENSNIGFDMPGNTLGIAGSPLQDGPFMDLNWTFDVSSLQVTSISSVPVPAAFWLFCSGLFGLMGIARRKS